jgi:hypothetical protein
MQPPTAPVPDDAVRVLQAFLDASVRGDEPAMRACLTRDLRESDDFDSSALAGVRFVTGAARVADGRVLVPVQAFAADAAAAADAQPQMEMLCVMVPEDGQWKLDLEATWGGMDADINAALGQVASALGDAMGAVTGAVGEALGGIADPAPGPPAPTEPVTDEVGGQAFEHLKPGQTYRVVRAFEDYDGRRHEPPETFTYRDYEYHPRDDGLTLRGSPADIRLRDAPEDQADVVAGLWNYLK